jgi:hypothetical protein
MGIQEDILHFEQSIGELIIKYEQYFLGLEKREPLKLLEEVDRIARRYANVQIVNTMLKFRYNALVARLNSYRQYWNRINRLIEDGKYSREKFKMERQQGRHQPPAPRDKPANGHDLDNVWQQYLAARRQCNLPVDTVSRDQIVTVIEKQRPLLMAKYNCAIEFKVVIQDGAPKIKAQPKK